MDRAQLRHHHLVLASIYLFEQVHEGLPHDVRDGVSVAGVLVYLPDKVVKTHGINIQDPVHPVHEESRDTERR